MKVPFTILFVTLLALSKGFVKEPDIPTGSCALPLDGPQPENYTNPTPSIPMEELPQNYAWTNVNGTDWTTPVANQFAPQWCGSCWAMHSASALSDRLKIATRSQGAEIILSPQSLISCDDTYSRGCWGGSAPLAYKYIYQHGITDTTCSPYRARGWTNGMECSEMTECWSCSPNGYCGKPKNYPKWTVSEYGYISDGEEKIMNEIYARGPVPCGIYSGAPGFHNYTDGIYSTTDKTTTLTHYITLVGWGVEDDTPYWLGKNSFGDGWGFNNGYFKLLRGEDNLGIESNGCAWAVPKVEPTIIQNDDYPVPDVVGQLTEEPVNHEENMRSRECVDDILPRTFDWRDNEGQNYLSSAINQNSPYMCDGAWLVSTIHALSTRFNVLDKNQWPRTNLNPQVLLNCQPDGGSCQGGSPAQVYSFMKSQGLTGAGCQQWIATNTKYPSCGAIDKCKTCAIPSPRANEDGQESCWAVESSLYYVSAYGRAYGISGMKTEIQQNGPITCSMKRTAAFQQYTGGIYSEKMTVFPQELNHYVEVVGWDVSESGQEYWIGRNSWGTFWGDNGFFMIDMYDNNLGINQVCTWATPTHEQPTV